MSIWRTYVFSPQAQHIRRLLLSDPSVWLLNTFDGETDVYSLLLQGEADLVILDENMPGIDPLHLLKRLANTPMAHPRVLYISAGPSPVPQETDAAIPADFDQAMLFRGIKDAISAPCAQLSGTMEKEAAQHSERLCASLKTAPSLKGYPYICRCAAWQALSTSPLSMTALYKRLAQHFSVTPASAERCIRTAIEYTWLHGDLQAISNLFGYTVDPEKGKPTNQEFIAMLSRHVKNKLQQKG